MTQVQSTSIGSPRKDISGQTFGRLTALEWSGFNEHGQSLWKFKCSCGSTIVTAGYHAVTGNTKSCGCLNKERLSSEKRNLVHGLSNSKEWIAWRNIRVRCADKNNRRYGGRGIKVCERWLESFDNFYADMGPSPSRSHSIDRYPDNDGNYEPGNCRWATTKEQRDNSSVVKMIEYDGLIMCIKDWARKYGVGYTTLCHRLKNGWPMFAALTTAPLLRNNRRKPDFS